MRFDKAVETYSPNIKFITLGLEEAEMASTHVLRVGEDEYRLDDISWKSFADLLGFSIRGLEKASDELKMEVFDYFINENRESEVVLQTANGHPVFFYRADKPLLPIQDILQKIISVSSSYLGHVGGFEVASWLDNNNKLVIDLISSGHDPAWDDKDLKMRAGVRLIINIDTKSTSYVESLLQITPKLADSEPFYISSPVKNLSGKVSAKGYTREEMVDLFSTAVESAIFQAEGHLIDDIPALWSGPMSESEPKVDSVLEEAGVPKTVRPKIKDRIGEARPDFFHKLEVSEMEAVVAIGEQTPSLGKTKMKLERFLGELINQGGEQETSCEMCAQRLPND